MKYESLYPRCRESARILEKCSYIVFCRVQVFRRLLSFRGFKCVYQDDRPCLPRESCMLAARFLFRGTLSSCSIPDFLQELPVLIKEATPTLSMMFGEDIERKLSVREIQTAFVHILVLGKKARVMLRQTLYVGHTLQIWSLFACPSKYSTSPPENFQ